MIKNVIMIPMSIDFMKLSDEEKQKWLDRDKSNKYLSTNDNKLTLYKEYKMETGYEINYDNTPYEKGYDTWVRHIVHAFRFAEEKGFTYCSRKDMFLKGSQEWNPETFVHFMITCNNYKNGNNK